MLVVLGSFNFIKKYFFGKGDFQCSVMEDLVEDSEAAVVVDLATVEDLAVAPGLL